MSYGDTRVELGVQVLDDEIYKKIKRGHKVEDVIKAVKLLKDSGFKVGFHLMPNLVSDEKEDLRLFQHVGAMMVMVFGVITLFPGFSGINYTNLQGQALGFSTIGLGFYFLIENFFSRDKQVESFDQEDDGRLHD